MFTIIMDIIGGALRIIRSIFSKIRSAIFFLLPVFLFSSFNSIKPKPLFISIAFIKSTSPDFIQHEKAFWLPIQKELIKAGRKDAWYMYKINAPADHDLSYDYVRFNVFHDKEQTKAPYAGIQQFVERVYPGQDMSEQMKKTNSTRTMIWEQLYEIKGDTPTWVLKPESSLSFLFNAPSPGSKSSVQLQAIEPLKKENLYQFISISRKEKKSTGYVFDPILPVGRQVAIGLVIPCE